MRQRVLQSQRNLHVDIIQDVGNYIALLCRSV